MVAKRFIVYKKFMYKCKFINMKNKSENADMSNDK